MLTHCPHCQAQFRLTAEQLSGARGMVRCRRCFEIFNAIQHLLDDSGRPVARTAPASASSYQAAEQWLAARPPPETRSAAVATVEAEPESESLPVSRASESVPDSSWDDVEDDEELPHFGAHDADDADGPSGAMTPDDEAPGVSVPAYAEPLEAAFDNPFAAPQRSSRVAHGAWFALALLLLVALPGQYLYFMRDALAQQPRWRPWVEYVCRWADCVLPLMRDSAQLELITRDVVTHPRLAKALLINVAWVNHASFTQPYPILAVTLSGLNGEKVAMRRFRPEEYLGEGMALAAGMPPEEPVHVVLEVAAPSRAVSSYEFSFL
jgi:predicted Zn finger-like uncharacterized protein